METSTLSPPSSSAPPFPGSYFLSDNEVEQKFQFPQIAGQDARAIDDAGNVIRMDLQVRTLSVSGFVRVGADLLYDELNRLTRVERNDGVVIASAYGPNGLRIRRTITGDANKCVPSDTAFIYDGDLLIQEYDLVRGRLQTLYYYADGQDVPVAGDFWNDTTSTLDRHYFLTDLQGTVLAVADASGEIIEYVTSDAWGQPQIQSRDVLGPQINVIVKEGDVFLVTFSEPVVVAATSSTLANAFELTDAAGDLSVTVTYDDTLVGYYAGRGLRLDPTRSLSGNLIIELPSTTLVDEWGNPNEAVTLTIANAANPPSSTVYTNPDARDTGPVVLRTSSVGSPFLFHGQVFDYDAGLVYLRARFYDPASGLFLQPDPMGFKDSGHLYAAFANNPINLRDPKGTQISGCPNCPANLEEAERQIRAWVAAEDKPQNEYERIPKTNPDSPEHNYRVVYVINYALLKGGADPAQTYADEEYRRMCQSALFQLNNLRNSDVSIGTSESLVLRDAQRYLYGSTGDEGVRQKAAEWGFPREILDQLSGESIDTVYDKAKWAALKYSAIKESYTGESPGLLRGNPQGPLSARGGEKWLILGLERARELEGEGSIGKGASPFITESPEF